MGKQEVIERLNNKLDEVFAFQRSFEPLTGAYMECESKASAYMIAINYVEQLDESQKVKVPAFVAEWIEYVKKKGDSFFDSFSPWDLYGAEYVEADRWIAKNGEIYGRAWLDGYEVEEADKWMVKSNQLYFTGVTQLIAHDPLTYNFVKDQKHAHIFDDKKSAEKEASYFNGTVEKVGE